MRIENIIESVRDGKPRDRKITPIGVGVHRVGVDHGTGIDLGDSAFSVCNHFNGRNTRYPEIARATGGHLPYTLIVEEYGLVAQCLRISDMGFHARRWSRPYIGVAAIGDFRTKSPSRAQWVAAVDIVAFLCHEFGIDPLGYSEPLVPTVAGHDELPSGSRDAGKRCPGDRWNMEAFRREVHESLTVIRETECMQLGIIL